MEEHVNPPRQGLYDPQNEHDSCGVGFVVDLKGRKSNKIVRDGVQILLNLEHRGACGAEKNTGDGAGILIQIPHTFLAAVCAEAKGHITLPAVGHYGVGMVFLPSDPGSRAACEHLFEKVVRDEGQRVLGWREVPVDSRMLGPTARKSQPVIKQLFIARHPSIPDDDAFERKLYVIRRRARHAVRRLEIPEKATFYISSLSSRTIVYKGMLNCDQLTAFYLDLQDERVESALALVHSRFSTNTFPNWSRAHPYRMIAHNGEINTLRGNVNWMHARESMFASKLFGDDLQKCIPVVDTEGSDSGMFDNVLELLFLAGRSLPHAMMMMIPEPWSNHESMSRARKDFYEFHGCLMEPWDGPASVAFTDGVRIGATLDRNGLRPSRYYVTKDGVVVMASEVGVLDIPPENILEKGRLQPGRMFLVDTAQGRIIGDDEIKDEMASAAPYGQWLKENLISIGDLPKPPSVIVARSRHGDAPPGGVRLHHRGPQGAGGADGDRRRRGQRLDGDRHAAGGAVEQTAAPLQLLQAAVRPGDQPAGRRHPRRDHHGGRHRDRPRGEPARADARLGAPDRPPHAGAAQRGAREAPQPRRRPQLARVQEHHPAGALRRGARAARGCGTGIEALRAAASKAIADGNNIIILSDRGHDRERAPIPALLTVASVQHHLLREGSRTRVGLVLETGEPREVHHFALLLGYGASAMNPYLAFESLHDMVKQGLLPGDAEKAEQKYVKAVAKGIVKVCSKMGISTIQSYHGAQVFEAIGLNQPFIDEYFTWTATRVEGIGIDAVADEVRQRHLRAFPERPLPEESLEPGGQYQYRRNGEYHLFNPESIHKLQYACRTGDFKIFKEYSQARRRSGAPPLHAARPDGPQVDPQAGAARRGRADRGDSEALQDRRHVVRLDQQRGARDAGDRHEPHRRQEQHRRGRRGSGALRPRRQR